MKKYYLYILLSVSIGFSSCQNNACSNLGEIEVSSWLQAQARKTGFPYCSVMARALQKEPDALAQLIRFAYKTDDDTAVEHGIAFGQLLLTIGDDYFYEFIQTQHEEQQLLVAKMLDAALEFSDPTLPILTELPKTAAFLKLSR